MFIRYDSRSFLTMATLGLLMVSAILGQNQASINTTLPNDPLLYANDEVRVRCNDGFFGDPPPTEFGLIFPGNSQNYRCVKSFDGFAQIQPEASLIEPVRPANDSDCRELVERNSFEFVFKPREAGLTYQCLMYDGTTIRRSRNETLPATIHVLPTDTQLQTDRDNYYEGSTVTATCTITGGVPTTTTYQYSFAGQTQNVTDAWTFRANRTMTGDISCTSTEHVLYRDRSQPGLVASKTINIYYIDLTSEARGGVEKVLNPEYDNSIDCQEFQDTNLPTRDLTYSWTGDGKTINEATLRLPKSKASGTVQHMCDITGPKFRAADPDQTRRVVVNVMWSSTAPPPADDGQNAPLSTGAIGGIVVSVFLVLVVVVALIITARHRVLCFKRSRSENASIPLPDFRAPDTEHRRTEQESGAPEYEEVIPDEHTSGQTLHYQNVPPRENRSTQSQSYQNVHRGESSLAQPPNYENIRSNQPLTAPAPVDFARVNDSTNDGGYQSLRLEGNRSSPRNGQHVYTQLNV